MTEYLLDHQWMLIRHIPVSTSAGQHSLCKSAITLTAPPHCSQVPISIPKNRLSHYAQVIDWCFCARVLSCLVSNACLVLFRFASIIVMRCLLWCRPHHGKLPRRNTPRKRIKLTLVWTQVPLHG
ncbi:MAG: hypothetical protein ACI89W_001943 [Gammaproteobacteria bacterium]|jgi:hypothetical protein